MVTLAYFDNIASKYPIKSARLISFSNRGCAQFFVNTKGLETSLRAPFFV